MSTDPNPVHQAECTLALNRCLLKDPDVMDPFGLACAMFFAGVDAQIANRELVAVERELLATREQLEQILADRIRDRVKPRRRPNFGGGT